MSKVIRHYYAADGTLVEDPALAATCIEIGVDDQRGVVFENIYRASDRVDGDVAAFDRDASIKAWQTRKAQGWSSKAKPEDDLTGGGHVNPDRVVPMPAHPGGPQAAGLKPPDTRKAWESRRTPPPYWDASIPW